MKQKAIAELQDEPACEHNQKSKSGCSTGKPGATAGGCAFDGAQITLLPIADVVHIVHGPIGCAGSSWDNRGTRSSGSQLFRLGCTTDLTEQDVIMGRGPERLFKSIGYVNERYQPAAVFVYNTCVPAMEGDDLQAICKQAEMQYKVPVVAVDSAGFYGSKNFGNRLAGETMVNKVIGTAEPLPRPDLGDIQCHDIGMVGEFNIAGEFWQILPLLDELGLRLLGCLSGDARFGDLQTLHRAEALMLVCSRALINVGRRLEEKYQIPWFEGSFYGVTDTSDALRQFAALIGDPSLTERTEALIAREELRVQQKLAPYRTILQGKRALLYTGGVKSWSVVAALQELGVEVVATGTKKSTEEDKARIKELMGENAVMLENGSPRELLDIAYREQVDVMIAGGRNMYTAYKAKLPFLDINQERDYPYAGYEGMVELARQLVNTIECPIWEQVRHPAPWEKAASWE